MVAFKEQNIRRGSNNAFPLRSNYIMHDLLPEGEDLRRAVQWISSHLLEDPECAILPLVNEAIFRFDLSPMDAEFLIGFYRRIKDGS